jgi:hypothetical protein
VVDAQNERQQLQGADSADDEEDSDSQQLMEVGVSPRQLHAAP